MRIFQHYKFLVRSKLPFSEWPAIIGQFFRDQGLQYQHFYFCFEDTVLDGYQNACDKAAKEQPELGPVVFWEHKSHTKAVLTNIGVDTGCGEAKILSLMPKLYRRYGFVNSQLTYQDVNFFGKYAPAMEFPEKPYPQRFSGASVTLRRDGVFPRWSCIELSIEISDGTKAQDTSYYRDAMAALLPGIKCMTFQEVALTSEEAAFYEERKESAQPLVERTKEFFEERMPAQTDLSGQKERVSVGKVLKKLCKAYGFTYWMYHYSLYFLRKRTDCGHYITLTVETGSEHNELDFCMHYHGTGFDLRTFCGTFCTQNPEEMVTCLDKLFQLIGEAEKTVLQPLAAHFPPTPDWFIP